MNKIREMFKAIVVSLKIQKLVIKESVTCSPMSEHAGPCPSVLAHTRARSPTPERARPRPSALAHARARSPTPEHVGPCPSMLAHARGVAVNAIIYIEDERETCRTRQIKIYIFVIYIYM